MAKTGNTQLALPNPARNPRSGGNVHASRRPHEFGWGDISADAIGLVVQLVTGSGEGIILGRTSDGGALSITILAGETRVREYPATVPAWDEFKQWVVDEYATL